MLAGIAGLEPRDGYGKDDDDHQIECSFGELVVHIFKDPIKMNYPSE